MVFAQGWTLEMFAKFYALRSTGRRFFRDERGGPAAEFAMTVPILVAVLLATLQVGVIFIAKAYLETGAEQAARMVLTNNATSLSQTQFQTAVCNQLPALFTCSNLIVQLSNLPSTATSLNSLLPTFNANGTLSSPTSYTASSSGTLMMLVVMYQWPVYGGILGLNWGNMGNGTMLMTSTQIFKVES
jgi:Flp pilus assembly protein TadG